MPVGVGHEANHPLTQAVVLNFQLADLTDHMSVESARSAREQRKRSFVTCRSDLHLFPCGYHSVCSARTSSKVTKTPSPCLCEQPHPTVGHLSDAWIVAFFML
jgi:hypothetical protein